MISTAMRLLTTILAAVCSLLLIFVVFFWVAQLFLLRGSRLVPPRRRGARRADRCAGSAARGRSRPAACAGSSRAGVADVRLDRRLRPTSRPRKRWSHPVNQTARQRRDDADVPTLSSGFPGRIGFSKVSDADLQWELAVLADQRAVLARRGPCWGIAPFRWVQAFREASAP
jgi:hypothetical protein